MFGTRKPVEKTVAVEETPDLVMPVNAGMPGFVEDPVPAKAPAKSKAKPKVAPLEVAPVAPEPVVEAKEQYQVAGAELLENGLYRYIVITNKKLGEVGGVYDM